MARTRISSVIFAAFSSAIAVVRSTSAASSSPRSDLPERRPPSVRKAAAMWARSASIKTTGIPICACSASRSSVISPFLSPRSITTCGSAASSVSRFRSALLPYIWPVSGSAARFAGRKAIWLSLGAALMVTMHSGAIAARIIVATAPLGAMRVISAGSSTVLLRLSVKDTVSGSAGASSSAGDSSVWSGSAAVSSAAGLSVCAVSGAAASCLPDAQPVMRPATMTRASRSARILLFIFVPPMV